MDKKAQDIAALVELFQGSEWDEMHVEIDGVQLFLSTDPEARLDNGEPRPSTSGVSAKEAPSPVVAAPVAASTAAPTDAEVEAHWIAVTAPNLGTFYRAPKPGAPAYVEVGQAVEASTDVCLLEVMKLFTTIQAGTKGTVCRICVNDADMVEFGQTLFYVDPS